MPRCAVKFCPHFKRRPGEDNSGIRCHLFPVNLEQRQRWVDWVQKTNVVGHFKASAQSGLCSAYFTPESYLPSQRLKKDAIPLIAPRITPKLALKLGIVSSLESFSPQEQSENMDPSKSKLASDGQSLVADPLDSDIAAQKEDVPTKAKKEMGVRDALRQCQQ